MTTHKWELDLPNEQATMHLGECMSECLQSNAVVYLRGELGAGKTTLVRAALQKRISNIRVKSPTYSLIERYQFDDLVVIHADLYRLTQAEELEYLGLRDWLAESACLVVEWPENAQGILPAATMEIALTAKDEGRCALIATHNLALLDCLKKTVLT